MNLRQIGTANLRWLPALLSFGIINPRIAWRKIPMKTCRYCAEKIQDAAKICPHCRKRVGMRTVAKLFVAFLFAGVLGHFLMPFGEKPKVAAPPPAQSSAEPKATSRSPEPGLAQPALPKFEVTSHAYNAVALLVSK